MTVFTLDEKRMLRDTMVESYVAVDVEPSETSDPEMLHSDWIVVTYEETKMYI